MSIIKNGLATSPPLIDVNPNVIKSHDLSVPHIRQTDTLANSVFQQSHVQKSDTVAHMAGHVYPSRRMLKNKFEIPGVLGKVLKEIMVEKGWTRTDLVGKLITTHEVMGNQYASYMLLNSKLPSELEFKIVAAKKIGNTSEISPEAEWITVVDNVSLTDAYRRGIVETTFDESSPVPFKHSFNRDPNVSRPLDGWDGSYMIGIVITKLPTDACAGMPDFLFHVEIVDDCEKVRSDTGCDKQDLVCL